jgi:hypothetical protein
VGWFIAREHVALLDVTCDGRIGHQHIELEVAIVLVARLLADLAQAREAGTVGVVPLVLLHGLVPLGPVKRVEVQEIALAVAGDAVQAAGNADTLSSTSIAKTLSFP